MSKTPFNWAGLPTEVKEKALVYCTSDFVKLFRVSRQVRAICIALTFRLFFHLFFEDPVDFSKQLYRLDKKRQFSAPVNFRDYEKAHLYKYWPSIYPDLSRFSTFKHAVQKATLKFDFREYLHFFKITTNGFNTRGSHPATSSDDLKRLTKLHDLTIILPGNENTETLWDRARDWPRIFHENPCPRALHRAIYERVAKDLIYIPHVKVVGFLDPNEEARFYNLRQHAIKSNPFPFTRQELDELYADDAGGIKLTQDEAAVDTKHLPVTLPYWDAPECKCEVPCVPIFRGVEADELPPLVDDDDSDA
ncbi:unnamed protein product [Periconia digitata]|uniref:F-box domain-containing protein n=1 Tax=Periconia digitata TaxID=1303443 RepID=A0A9W4XLZ0_9PLEO|nr:unnamed protein product [Periconia digitata]